MCPGKENNVELHLEGTPLGNCIKETNYGDMRDKEKQEECSNAKKEVARINSILKNSGQSSIFCNPCTKNTQGTNFLDKNTNS